MYFIVVINVYKRFQYTFLIKTRFNVLFCNGFLFLKTLNGQRENNGNVKIYIQKLKNRNAADKII